MIRTSARESDVRIRVHKELHVEHFPYHLRVKDENSFKEDNVRWVNCDPLFHPGNIIYVFYANSDAVKNKINCKKGLKSILPGMSDEVICRYFNYPSLDNVL